MFDFILYVKPLWYFRLLSNIHRPIIMENEELIELVNQGEVEIGTYKNEYSTCMDLAYQALLMGYLPNQEKKRSFLQGIVISDTYDNYKFIHRHFGRGKAIYVLLLRLAGFKNPFKEVKAFYKSFDKKISISYKTIHSKNKIWPQNINDCKVSVIIPTLNRYEYLKDVLMDLEKQTYLNFDVWVCDQSDNFNPNFYKEWNLSINLIFQKEKALWLARNTCIEKSTSEWLLFCEDDIRIEEDWIQKHLDCVKQFNTKISCGIFNKDKNFSIDSQFFRISDFFASGNSLVHRSVFTKTGLFDRNFENMRMGDGEFGLRCFISGEILIQNPNSFCIDLKAPTGGLRHSNMWDMIHNIGIFKPRPVPSSLYIARKYFDSKTAFYLALSVLPKSFIPYSRKNLSYKQNIFFYFLAIIFVPVILYTFKKSWDISSIMLKNKFV